MNEQYIGKRVIVRGKESGVYYGTLVTRNGQEVELANARNIWYWSGAASLLQMANEGVKRPKECKFTQYVDSIVLTDVCEILPCTDASIKSIEGVAIWSV